MEVGKLSINQTNLHDKMLENYLLAKESMPKNQMSSHWDVFPDDFEKAIQDADAWKFFLRNAISIGFNDDLIDFGNARFIDNNETLNGWEMRKKHDFRLLLPPMMKDSKLKNEVGEHLKHLFSICGIEFVLNNIGSNVGSPMQLAFSIDSDQKTYYCNRHELGIIYYLYQISRSIDLLLSVENPTVVEIGAGFGSLIGKLKSQFPKSRCILLDLPELSAVQTYYLFNSFPETNICLYDDYLKMGTKVFSNEFDFLILPGWIIEEVGAEDADLFINMRSMMEMTYPIISYYFNNIQRIIKNNGLFACINRYEKYSRLKDYPFDDFWEIVLSQTSQVQNHVHDLILRRSNKKNPFPISEVLKTFPPHDKR